MDAAGQTTHLRRRPLPRHDDSELKVYISRPRSAWRPIFFVVCGLVLGIVAGAFIWDAYAGRTDAETPAGSSPGLAPAAPALQPAPPSTQGKMLPIKNEVRLAPQPAKNPAGAVVGDRQPEWEVVMKADFSNAKSLEQFVYHPNGDLQWNKMEKCLEFGETKDGLGREIYVMFKKSLPGDLRVSFRARKSPSASNFALGALISLEGSLKIERGYFLEWNSWRTQIQNKTAGTTVQDGNTLPEKITNGEWGQFTFERRGGKLSMSVEGKSVLTWTDPTPYAKDTHDLFSFYLWNSRIQLDDLVIERNPLDTLKPRADQPATQNNYVRDNRAGFQDFSADENF